MRLTNKIREKIAFTLAGAAIILRMASDWIFPHGGPFPYQILQAFLLLLALVFIRQHLDLVFLRGGQIQLAIKIGLLGIPLGFIFGLGDAWLGYGCPVWPGLIQMALLIANNLFFPAVEELEFRGFLFLWLSKRNISPRFVILVVAIFATYWHMRIDSGSLTFVQSLLLLL